MTIDPATLHDLESFERAAGERLDRAIWDLLAGGAGSGAAIARNRAAWGRWALRSRALRDVSRCGMATRLPGTEIASPILIAPSGLHGLVHPAAERATAAAARTCDTLMVLSTNSSLPVEEVAAEGAKLWFQLYWGDDRGFLREIVGRAGAAGCRALCLTVDMPTRPWIDARMRRALAAIGGIEPAHGLPRSRHGDAGARWDHDARLTWADLAWLRERTKLPIVLKGIMGADDARLAADHGADAIIVSNHGGRVLEEGQATAEVLEEVVDAVAGRIDVLVDGGIRTGSDVAKALAIGAKAVLVGRPVQWGLAVAGADGAARVLDLLRDELASVMGMIGAADIADIDRSSCTRRSPVAWSGGLA